MKIISMLNGTLIIGHERAKDLTNAELQDIIMRLLNKQDKDYLIDTLREMVDLDSDAKEFTGLDGLPYTEIEI